MNIGIIGTGGIAAAHALGINSLDDAIARLYSCCDIDQSKLEAFCSEYGGKPFGTVEAMLDDKDLDAVVICLPHGLHAPIGIQAMQAGKHVLVEKPMASCVADCRELIRTSRETGKKLQVGHEYYLYPTVQKAAQILQSGEIGRPLMVKAECPSYIYNLLGTWWMDFEKAKGGPAINMGPHLVDIVGFILNKKPRRVRGFSRQLHSKAVKGIEDYFVMELDFGDGIFGDNRIYSFAEKVEAIKPAVTIFGEDGYLTVWSNELLVQHRGGTLESRLKADGSKACLVFAEQIRQFCCFVEQNIEPRTTGQFGLEAVACIEGAVRGDGGSWQSINNLCTA